MIPARRSNPWRVLMYAALVLWLGALIWSFLDDTSWVRAFAVPGGWLVTYGLYYAYRSYEDESARRVTAELYGDQVADHYYRGYHSGYVDGYNRAEDDQRS